MVQEGSGQPATGPTATSRHPPGKCPQRQEAPPGNQVLIAWPGLMVSKNILLPVVKYFWIQRNHFNWTTQGNNCFPQGYSWNENISHVQSREVLVNL